MRRHSHFWWVSLLLIVVTLAQVLPQSRAEAKAAPRQPASPAMLQDQPSAALSFTALVMNLDHKLNAFQGVDSAGYAQARTDLRQAWTDVMASAQQAHTEGDTRAQELAARGLDSARARQALQVAQIDQKIALLNAQFQSILRARDVGAARSAAQSFAAALHASGAFDAAPRMPEGDLTTREENDAAPIAQLPALADIAPTSSQANGAAVPDASAPPRIEDVLGNEDAAITPEILALAEQLKHDPVAIYQYVRNKIGFDPYYGSRKGSLLTLWERSGNDVDTASLLIALLRASGIPARYVQGTAAFAGTAARNWVGNAPDLATAAKIVSSGGTPTGTTANGLLTAEHVWVAVCIGCPKVNTHAVYLPTIGNGRGSAAAAATTPSAEQAAPSATGKWVALDASFKQFTYHEPANLDAVTGVNATQWVSDIRKVAPIDDKTKALAGIPKVPSTDDPDNPDSDREYVDLHVDNAVAKTASYIQARPKLTNADLLGGGYIITQTLKALPTTLPFTTVAGKPIVEFSTVPAAHRTYLTIDLLARDGTPNIHYRASAPSLANQRITLSYRAWSAQDQRVIDSYGGALLTTPPVVDLVPELRIGGTLVATGLYSNTLGTVRTRRLTFENPTGTKSSVENGLTIGAITAIGLDYGRTSQDAVLASQARLAAARAALPLDATHNPDPKAPGNLSESVMGESLNTLIQTYWNQTDVTAEMVARSRHVRWFRGLSGGVATQDLVITSFFGIPFDNLGASIGFDIQRNVFSINSLQNRAYDTRTFLQTIGYIGSSLEHALFENESQGSVSTMRLLEIALQRGIPVYRIDQTNKASVMPKLSLDSSIESYISKEIDAGKVVTVSEQMLKVNQWSGVGFIVLDPVSGAASYLISGGLNGVIQTFSGGSFWDILGSILAAGLFVWNLMQGLEGLQAGLMLLFLPEAGLLTLLFGAVLIIASLAAIFYDIANFMDLLNGKKSLSDYIGEQMVNLMIGQALAKLGGAAAAALAERLGTKGINALVTQLNHTTDGAIGRLMGVCTLAAGEAWSYSSGFEGLRTLTQPANCTGFAAKEIAELERKLGLGKDGWQALDKMVQGLNGRGMSGVDIARTLMNNPYIGNKPGAILGVTQAVLNAPAAKGIETTIQRAVARQDFGYAYELQRAIANRAAGESVAEYGKRINVTYQRITGFDAAGNPIKGGTATSPLEGDLALGTAGRDFVDAKYGPQGNQELRIWNQIQKAQAAINAGQIDSFRFECSGTMGQAMQTWARTNAPDVQFVTKLGDVFWP